MNRRIPALILIAVVAWLWAAQAGAAPREADTVYRDGFDPYGTLLEGPPERLAIDAIVDMPPIPAPEDDIEDDLILTRLDLFIDRTATVGQINAAITEAGGWIVTMTPGRAALTISIPRAADRTELRAMRDALNAREGILMASLAEVGAEQMLPDPPAGDALHAGYLYASRFPAAWNASRLATADCTSRKVRVRILDKFSALSQDLSALVDDQLPNFHLLTPLSSGRPTLHGYDVAMTAAARFDPLSQTGADPFPECLELQGTGANGMSWIQRSWLTSAGIGNANAVVNASIGNHRPCSTACTPADFDKEDIVADAFRGIEWRAGSREHDGNVLYVTAAGNDLDLPISGLYPYYSSADFASPMNLSASGEFLGDVPADDSDDFTFLRSVLLLDPIDPAYPSLIASDADMQRVRRYAHQNLGVDPVRSPNILIVGSTTRASEAAQVRPSLFSDPGSAIQAVGEGILGLDETVGSGTSVSAPQVAGLVSYLWLLSDELRAAPLATTIATITANARSANSATLLDAYASVLSLDAADPTSVTPSAQTMPIRLALLDVDGDGRFTETDLTTIQQHLLTSGGPSQLQDGSRYDLNGDGYTGGFHADRFDLDRVGSTQFGATSYTRVTGSIDGRTRTYDENQLLDIDILCYYAYSPLYTGDTGVRTQAIGAACGNPFGGHDTLDIGVPLNNAYSGGASGYIFAAGTFGYYPTVQRFSFATMGWGAAERLALDTDQNRVLGLAANADDAVVLLGMGSATSPMESRRFVPSLDTWSPEGFIDVSTAPRFAPSNVDPAFARGPQGSALVAWVAGVSDTQRSLAASRFDPVAQQWLAPEIVAETLAGPPLTRPSALVDASGNAYVVAYARSFSTLFYRFDRAAETWGAIEDFPGVYVYSLGVDASGRLLGVGGDAQGHIVSSRYEPATGHWSAPLALPVFSMYESTALASTVPGAPYGGGSEACQLRLLCVDAQGNALVLLPVTLSEGPNAPVTLGAFHLDAAANRWQDFGVVGRGTSFSIGMGYQSGNADIAWSTDTFGSMYVRHVDARTGLRPAQMFFQSSPPTDYYLIPPAVLHDESSAAIVVWGSASTNAGQIRHYWMPVY